MRLLFYLVLELELTNALQGLDSFCALYLSSYVTLINMILVHHKHELGKLDAVEIWNQFEFVNQKQLCYLTTFRTCKHYQNIQLAIMSEAKNRDGQELAGKLMFIMNFGWFIVHEVKSAN